MDNPGKVVTKFQFSGIFRTAWTRSMTVPKVTAGFRITGIHPLNHNALSPPTSVHEKLSEETGLLFLSMYSPISRPNRKPVANDSEGFT